MNAKVTKFYMNSQKNLTVCQEPNNVPEFSLNLNIFLRHFSLNLPFTRRNEIKLNLQTR